MRYFLIHSFYYARGHCTKEAAEKELCRIIDFYGGIAGWRDERLRDGRAVSVFIE